MTGKSLGLGLGAITLAALVASTNALASDGLPSLGVPGNTVGSPLLDHSADLGAGPIRAMPGAAGINPVRPGISAAFAARSHLPASVPVPPTQELELLDPNVDPLGRPTAKVSQTVGPDGLARIDIPPAVLVHRFYYTGDRSFQGPMLPGGPTIVVVNHPADGERIYLQIQMLPGAPRIIYTRHSIEYNYGAQAIILSFGAHGRPKVTFRQGISAVMRGKIAHEETRQSVQRFIARTGVPEARRKIREQARNVGRSAADRIHDIGKAAVTPVIQLVKLVPGINLLTNPPEQSVENEREVLLKRGTAQLASFDSSIKTVR
jgi:hypothetical protein